jgi:hypothetical protein
LLCKSVKLTESSRCKIVYFVRSFGVKILFFLNDSQKRIVCWCLRTKIFRENFGVPGRTWSSTSQSSAPDRLIRCRAKPFPSLFGRRESASSPARANI